MNCVSITQEIQINAVSNFIIHPLKLFSTKNETQAGVMTYPIPPCTTPACKLAPIGCQMFSDITRLRCGESPQGASNYLNVLEVQWLNTLFALPAMEGREVTGSIPVKYIPNGLNLQLFRSDPDAGNFFTPLTPTLTPASTIIMGGN